MPGAPAARLDCEATLTMENNTTVVGPDDRESAEHSAGLTTWGHHSYDRKYKFVFFKACISVFCNIQPNIMLTNVLTTRFHSADPP